MSLYCNLGFLFFVGQNVFVMLQKEDVHDFIKFNGSQSIIKFVYLFMTVSALLDHLLLMILGGCLLTDINAKLGAWA